MRKALGSLTALIVSALLLSSIISFFTRDTFEALPVKSSGTPVKLTRRVQDTAFLVPAEQISRYNFRWLAEQLQLSQAHTHRLLPVPANFYVANQLAHAEYPVAGLEVLDGECGVKTERIAAVRRYFRSLQVSTSEGKKTPLHIASFRSLPESITLRYTDGSLRTAKCLAAQLIALGDIAFLQDSVSLVLPAYQSVRVNLAPYERYALLAQAGRNIYAGIAEAHRKNPAHRVRVLLTNLVPYAQAQLLPFSELAGQFVGLTPDELSTIKNAALAANGSVVYVPDLARRIDLGLDTSVVWQLWQSPKVPFYKDASGEPLLYEDFLLTLRRALTDSDAAGAVQNRRLKALYAAYARDNDEKRKWGESINLPYQRASTERLQKLQLQLLLDVYDFSAIGLEAESYIALEMPARQRFPLLYMTVRPLAKRLGFDEKKDGSDVAEIEGSLQLVRSALAQAGK